MDVKYLAEVYDKAAEVLEKCATPHGFFAAFPGYDMVFARDSVIMSFGVPFVKNEKLKEAYRNSLVTLAWNQSAKGQIPNAVDKFSGRKPHVDYMSIDSSLWFIIGHYYYMKKFHDNSLFNKYKKNIDKAFDWLACQDAGEDSMPEQLPTTDWQDAFPHRYGHTINTQALYYFALRLAGKNREAERLKSVVNADNDFKLWNGEFYLPWRWKNHGKYHEMGNWFDTLGNLLAIVFDLADDRKAEKILSYIKNHGIDKPYPIKAIYPPIKQGSRDWQDYFLDCDAKKPSNYLNAGIWTYVGAFYILALIKLRKFKDAEKQMQKLAEANMKNNGNFAEWLNGKSGKIGKSSSGRESYQGWNAGMYIFAYESLKARKVLI
ncbi:MAG TPA: glycoside hydrolase 100 family protein [Candidatus Omnitrophota bacterium]|nr:glycoside hydrolase 100 family protein [Candidatus Omnitrophota bacterium]